jgi:predicted nucleic acid-binding protein
VKTYVDSSALIPLYVTERFSDAADAAVTAAGTIPFTPIHRLELTNAFERLVGRRLLTGDECRRLYEQLQDDLDNGRLVTVAADLDAVFAQAVELSRAHAATCLARSLDLMHVAAAQVLGGKTFVSADDRQLAVARATGLKTLDIKRPTRRKKP